jgi:hypothetical protein
MYGQLHPPKKGWIPLYGEQKNYCITSLSVCEVRGHVTLVLGARPVANITVSARSLPFVVTRVRDLSLFFSMAVGLSPK